MGVATSKSPLERRNSVARRSQRRTLHNLKPKAENIHKEIKKFKGVTEDTSYIAIKNEIEYLKNDLTRRGRDLQPQVRNLYENIYKRVCEADDALQYKLQENQEKFEKKESKNRENGVTSPTPTSFMDQSEVRSEITSNVDDDAETVAQIHAEEMEARQLENSQEKRKTVELKLVKVISEEDSPKPFRVVSPAEKRKSILKVGVPVMPSAFTNELAAQSNRITRQYNTYDTPSLPTVQEILMRINIIVESLRQIELEIHDFIGKKHGRQYTRIRDVLNRYLIELNNINSSDEDAVEQIKICRNYVGSCLSFLDERATDDHYTDDFGSSDDVFENNNVPTIKKVEANFRMQKLLKNTAV